VILEPHISSVMGWTKEQIDEIAEECLASDIPYDLTKMQDKTEDTIREFFENGGADEAPPPPVIASADGDCWGALPDEIKWKSNGSVAVITMNRPEANNALDEALTIGLTQCVARVMQSPELRVVFLTGAGKMFCAGGDPKAFQNAAAQAKAAEAAGKLGDKGSDQNAAGALQFAKLLDDLSNLPCYVVALANGTAMGGGFGLLSCCDCVIAKKTAMFALSEVKLGVIPATISPYVVARIGVSNARRFFMTGEAITSDVAIAAGLVNIAVDDEKGLAKEAQRICKLMTLAAPAAIKASKKLVAGVANKVINEELMVYTAGQLAQIRMGKEAEAGMIAVQAGQKPPWAEKELVFPEV